MKQLNTWLTISLLGLAGCSGGAGGGGSSPSVTDYSVKGKLASLSVQTVRETSVGRAFATGNVTHVMAVSPSGANPERFLSAVNGDGTFSLGITSGKPYVIVFIDSSQSGKNMILGMFKSSALDSIAPLTSGGTTDMGEVTVANTGTATTSVSYNDLIASLGLTSTAAASLGAIDDLCLRYVNPDMDGDGTIDLLQSNRQFVMDFHVQLPTQKANGTNIKVDDLVGSFFPTDMKFNYGGTGVIAAYPSGFSTATSGTFAYNAGGTWDVTVVDHSNGSSDVAMTSGGTAFNQLQASSYDSGRMLTLMVPTKSTSELPKGELTYTFGGKTLTFTNVAVPSQASLVSGQNRFAPFIKLNKSNSGCSSSCTFASIDYKWMKNNGSGWVAATQEELDALVDSNGGFLSIRYKTLGSSKNVGAQLPRNAAGGTLNWNATDLMLDGNLTEAELLAMTENDLCNVGLSYDDSLGMRYFFGIEKSAANTLCQ